MSFEKALGWTALYKIFEIISFSVCNLMLGGFMTRLFPFVDFIIKLWPFPSDIQGHFLRVLSPDNDDIKGYLWAFLWQLLFIEKWLSAFMLYWFFAFTFLILVLFASCQPLELTTVTLLSTSFSICLLTKKKLKDIFLSQRNLIKAHKTRISFTLI